MPPPMTLNHASTTAPALWLSDDALTGIFDVAAELAMDIAPDLDRFDLGLQARSPGRGMMPFAAFTAFLEAVAERHSCPSFGFRLGRRQRPLSLGLVSQLPLLCPTIGEGFACFSHYARLYSGTFNWKIVHDGDAAIMRRFDTSGYALPMPQLITYSLTSAFVSMKHIMGTAWQPDGIYFTHDAPADSDALRRYFQTPVFYNSEFCGIAFPEHYLALPIATANPDLLASLTDHFDHLLAASSGQNSLRDAVLLDLKAHLGGAGCTLEGVAIRNGLHPRSLQRALAAEGASFRALYNQARSEVAVHLLTSSNSAVADIASMLGFAHTSALTRALAEQTGMTPTQMRRSGTAIVAKG